MDQQNFPVLVSVLIYFGVLMCMTRVWKRELKDLVIIQK